MIGNMAVIEFLKGTVYSKYKQFVDNCFEICPRCALHAKVLGFYSSNNWRRNDFEAPLPDDIKAVVAKWETYSTAKKLDQE